MMNSILASDPPPGRKLERCSIYFTGCAMATALATLIGWQWDIDLLRRPSPSLVAMNPTTALGLLLATFSFFCLKTGKPSRPKRVFGNSFARIVLAMGLLCLAGFLTPDMLHFDRLFYAQRLRLDSNEHHLPNQMAISTGWCFLLTGFSLLKLGASNETPGGRWSPVEVAAVLMAFPAFFSLAGFLYRVREFYGLLQDLRMAAYTALCFLLLAGAFILATPRGRIMGILAGNLTGSLAARRLLPFAFLFPLLLGELRLIGYWQGHLSTELGALFLVQSIIICFVLIIWNNTLLLNKRDAQRQQAESELKAIESRWELIVNSVEDYAIFLVDPEGKVLTWNEGAQRIKGYHSEEIIGQPISKFYTEEAKAIDEPRHNLEIAAAKGRHSSEGWRVRKNGERFWGEIVFTAIYDEHHRLQAFAKITRDTTEQKLAQEEIAYLARLIEDTSDAIFSTDSDGAIKTWNRAAETLFGYTAAEVIGQQATGLMRPQLTADVQEPIRRQLELDGYWKGEIMYLDRNGEERTILQSVSTARSSVDKPGGYVIVGRDVTQWKKVEVQLRLFNERLEAQVREQTAAIRTSNEELRALASHLTDIREEERASMAREVHDELGQQLTGLKMDLSLMARKASGESEDWLREKMASTMALLDTTIRTVRKIASELRPGILDDLGLIAALDWQAQEFGKRMGIPTSFETNGDGIRLSPQISIGLFRICQESLTNVARHSGATHVRIFLLEEKDHVLLSIRDDGRGIDPQKLKNKEKTLGLLGIKERAMTMGGTLMINSTVGAGVTLSIKVPIEPATKPK